MLTLSVLVFISISLGIAAAMLYLAPDRTAERLQALGAVSDAGGGAWTETVLKVVGPFARLSSPEGDWESSPLRQRFLNAGIRRSDARLIYFGLKTLLPLVFAGVVFVAAQWSNVVDPMRLLLYVLLAALAGCYLPNIVLYVLRRSRQQEIFETFPDAADLMLVCVEAGLGMDASLTKVADEMKRRSVALAEELHLTNLEMRAGGTREKALRNLALRTGLEEILTFASMLTQADKFGTSIGDSLRVFSDDLRHKRQVRAEERAAKVPTKLLFPLVVCIFPAIVAVILGPAAIEIIRTLVPMFTGGKG